jgi:hypothetical protein
MNYITNAELLNYYDSRRVLDLAQDVGVPLTVPELATADVVTTAIRQASARIDSAVQSGRRYERSQLEDIVTAANALSATDAEKSRAEPIKGLTAHLAFGWLMSRRGYAAASMRELAPLYDDAEGQLNLLASGERVLDLDAAKAAGVPQSTGIGVSKLKYTQYNPMFGLFPSNPIGYLYPGAY